MFKEGLTVICILLALLLIPGTLLGVLSPDQFRGSNFNLYPRPCPANEMVLKDLRGNPISLSSLRGKVVLLNFWRIDCPPCAIEKPILERVYRANGPRGLAVVAVNLFDDYNRMASFIGAHGLTFAIAYDPERSLSIRQQSLASGGSVAYVVNSNNEAIYEVPGVPTTYVIDRGGKIVGHGTGMINWELPPFSQLLASLLGAPPAVLATRAQPSESAYVPERSPAPPAAPRQVAVNPQPASVPDGSARFGFDGNVRHPVADQSVEGQAPRPREASLAPRQATPIPRSSVRTAATVQSSPPARPSASTKPSSPKRTQPRVVAENGRGTNPNPGTPMQTYSSPPVVPTAMSPQSVGTAPPRTNPVRTPGIQPPPASIPDPTPVQAAPPRGGVAQTPPASPRPATLPPALPYVRPQSQGQTQVGRAQPRGITPTPDGYTMAVVPGSRSPRAIAPRPATPQTSKSNALGHFISESFGAAPQAPPPVQQTTQPVGPPPAPRPYPAGAAPSSIGERLGQWGSGIRNVFSNIVPMQ